MFGVLLVIFEPPRKAACPNQQLPRRLVVPMWFPARERFPRDLLQEPFAHPDPGNRKRAEIQVAPQRNEGDRRDAHHVGAVAARYSPAFPRFLPALPPRLRLNSASEPVLTPATRARSAAPAPLLRGGSRRGDSA